MAALVTAEITLGGRGRDSLEAYGLLSVDHEGVEKIERRVAQGWKTSARNTCGRLRDAPDPHDDASEPRDLRP